MQPVITLQTPKATFRPTIVWEVQTQPTHLFQTERQLLRHSRGDYAEGFGERAKVIRAQSKWLTFLSHSAAMYSKP